MDNEQITSRTSGAASRPPQTDGAEDTPLFTEVTYTPSRRTANNGRPASPKPAPTTGGRFTENTSAYGGRDYTAERRTGESAPRPGRTDRAAPVYMELSWDDLRAGVTDVPPQQPQQEAPRRFEADQAPRTGAGAQYFGGFDQEMEELFYNRSAERQNAHRAQFTDLGSAEQRPTYSPAGPSSAPAIQMPDAQPRGTTLREALRRSARPQSVSPKQPAQGRSAPRMPLSLRTPASPKTQSTPRTQAAPRTNAAPRTTALPRTQAQPRYTAPRTVQRATTPPRPPVGGGGHARSGGSFLNGKLTPILAGGGALLLLLLIVLIVRHNGSPRNPAVNVPMATVAPMATIAPEETPETAAEATPTPSPAPSPTPSGPKAKRSGNLVVPADWGPVIPERSRAVYNSFFDRSCMVGNSLVQGFLMYAGMENIRYIYQPSITVGNAIGGLDLSPITLNEPGYYSNIYLMFGLNEVGSDLNNNIQGFKKLVDFIRQYQPDANIIIISVTPVIKRVDQDPGEAQSMERIDRLNATLKEFCVDQNCWYLDIYSILLDDEGYLSSEYAFLEDGKHFEKSGYVAWANYMKTHYVDDGLLSE